MSGDNRQGTSATSAAGPASLGASTPAIRLRQSRRQDPHELRSRRRDHPDLAIGGALSGTAGPARHALRSHSEGSGANCANCAM